MAKTGWALFWAIFSKTHPVTLLEQFTNPFSFSVKFEYFDFATFI
jgi:hypothetical protein